jgi:hypothetical protein
MPERQAKLAIGCLQPREGFRASCFTVSRPHRNGVLVYDQARSTCGQSAGPWGRSPTRGPRRTSVSCRARCRRWA